MNALNVQESAAQRGGISSDMLKLIAMVTMVIDHVGASLFPSVTVLRLMGRIAFPIYVWLLVMGFAYTSDLKKYLFRLGLFALISEVPFDLAISGAMTFQWQNIYFTLFLSLLMIAVLKLVLDGDGAYAWVCAVLVIMAAMLIAEWLHFDYGSTGPVLAAVFYLYWRNQRPELAVGFLVFSFSNMLEPVLNGRDLQSAAVWSSAFSTSLIESFGLVAVPFIQRCNGRRKMRRGKVFFYLFYPLHLLILYGIRILFF